MKFITNPTVHFWVAFAGALALGGDTAAEWTGVLPPDAIPVAVWIAKMITFSSSTYLTAVNGLEIAQKGT